VAELNGLDMLVFTGGIGENDIDARAETCANLDALASSLTQTQQRPRFAVISAENSPVTVRVIPPPKI